jgi:hypothetical protein
MFSGSNNEPWAEIISGGENSGGTTDIFEALSGNKSAYLFNVVSVVTVMISALLKSFLSKE